MLGSEHPSLRGERHRRTRPPWITVPSNAPGVQPSLRRWRRGGWAIRSVHGLCSGEGVLRRVRLAEGEVRCVRGAATSGEASRRQPRLRPIATRAGVGTETAGELSDPPTDGCNGCDLDGRVALVDDVHAARSNHGGGAHRERITL